MTSEQPRKTSLSDSVLEAIESGEVSMRPKWQFVLTVSLWTLGTALAGLTLVYLSSFIVFALRQNGSWFVTGFGSEGWREFLISMPWLLVAITLIFLALLAYLVKRYAFAYARPLLYSAVGIILVAGLGGFLIALTPLHSGLMGEAIEYRLPLAGGVYRQYGGRNPGKIVTGIIVEKNNTGYTIYDQDKELLMVLITPYTKMPPKIPELRDFIVVLGERHGDIVEAHGIKCLSGQRGVRPMTPPREDQRPERVF